MSNQVAFAKHHPELIGGFYWEFEYEAIRKERDDARLDAEDKTSIARIAVANFEQAENERDVALADLSTVRYGAAKHIADLQETNTQLQRDLDAAKELYFNQGVQAAFDEIVDEDNPTLQSLIGDIRANISGLLKGNLLK